MILSPEQVRAMRLRAQHLHQKASVGDLAEVVGSLCGVNAQSGPAMMLALRARVEGLEPADVEKAIENFTLARTWAMRGTIHLLDTFDLGWMTSLLGPVMIAKGRSRRLELGLGEEKIARGLQEIQIIMGSAGPMTRDELTATLNDRGVDIDRKSQAPYHLIAYAALKGLIYIGPDSKNGDQTYSLVSGLPRVHGPFAGDEALAELTIRYLKGYGPASPQDFCAWSGLSLADAKKGWKLATIRETFEDISVEDRVLSSLATQHEHPEESASSDTVVNLLPAFDPVVLGYADREYLVPGKYQKEVYHGGQTVPVVLVNGLAAGVWRYERRDKKLNVDVTLFGRGDRTIMDLVEEEAEDIGRFFGLEPWIAYRA
jgi:hypothetical protein